MKAHKATVTRAFNAHSHGNGKMHVGGGKSTPQNMKTKHPKMMARKVSK